MPSRAAQRAPTSSSQSPVPYVFQAYPSVRYHPDGRSTTVTSQQDEEINCPVEQGWVSTPFPEKPKPVVPPELTIQELKQKLATFEASAKEDMANVKAAFDVSWKQACKDHDELQQAVTRKDQEIAALQAELQKLRKAKV